uniref:Putative secreted protein salivary gland overexpressed n=1 Tax=Rhipicephalus microplus TaxID=6941 RepID=A0A6M2DEH4_RHIMP
MAHPSVFCAVFLLLSTTVSARAEKESSEDDIVQFWNTSDLIWTVFTTSWKVPLCKADLKMNISESHLLFRRAQIKHGQ